MNNSIEKLTSKDIWQLIKYGITAVISSAIVFVLPYLLLSGAALTLTQFAGSEKSSYWIGYLAGAVILYLVVSNLTDLLNSLSRLCADLAKMTGAMSFIKKAISVIFFLSYIGGWQHFPGITFFVSVLLLLPGAFTYDKYKVLLREKHHLNATIKNDSGNNINNCA